MDEGSRDRTSSRADDRRQGEVSISNGPEFLRLDISKLSTAMAVASPGKTGDEDDGDREHGTPKSI